MAVFSILTSLSNTVYVFLNFKEEVMRLRTKNTEPQQCSHLADLQSKFDAAIRNGNSFSQVKRIYVKIKRLKNYINSINVE